VSPRTEKPPHNPITFSAGSSLIVGPGLGCCYLALIPIAAGVYAIDGHGFYDNNLSREPSALSDLSQLALAITKQLDANTAHASAELSGQRYGFVRPPQVEQVVRGQGARGTFVAEIYSEIASRHELLGGPLWFQIGPELGIERVGTRGEQYIYSEKLVGPDGVGTASLSRPLNLVPDVLFVNASRFHSSLVVAKQTAQGISRVSAAFLGDPSQASGLYLRMLYLSATTITTLGIGDIQPVSSAGRTWVSAEAILGIVLAGLFLSAIGSRALARR